MNQLARFLPFLKWFPLRAINVKADFLAGITIALILVPQSMAYAQLAGLPAYYGLYAAFLPGIIAAMWGSSAQLATGPVAVVSLLTASALAPLAASGSTQFIALAIMMAFMVGIIQLALGVFKLGVVVNFLSHPVIVGFTNAAAIIISLSQLNKVFGVSMGRSEHFIQDIWGVLQQVGDTHIPTLLMGVSAFAIMWGLKKYLPRLPGVLIAVVITTVVSWSIGFEHNSTGRVTDIMDPEVKTLADNFSRTESKIDELNSRLSSTSTEVKQHQQQENGNRQRIAALNYEIELLRLELRDAENENRNLARSLRKFIFEQVPASEAQPARLYLLGQVPQNETGDGYRWRIKKVNKGELNLVGGGEVVGMIPAGMPQFDMPKFSWDMMLTLFTGALVISLVGFMEAISIAKAIAAKTKDRIDPNQELVGQGLANIVGSFSQAFPASGSFSRSAVNLNAGAKTGMSSVFAGVFVLITLLFLTPLLYHLPQAVLAAVIMMAVIGLINFKAILHAWHTHKHDGIASVVTFVATLAFAPHLDSGIMVGAGLAIILYLYRTMTPRVAILGRHPDGTLRDASVHNLPVSEYIVAVRYDGSLYFANVSYFEDTILEAVAGSPNAKHLLIVAEGINQLDASGDEVIHHVVERLRSNGIRVVFSGLKNQVIEVMKHSGLLEYLGRENIFSDEDKALASIYAEVLEVDPNAQCRLMKQHIGGDDGVKTWL
ncbi:MAG: sodium-independent anion transporter [Gallionellales bacterium 35-53-114]|jgi:SulP family sulfate permease|nr:MAG: sodium-independent anion transporter [Gallionellales bacterium 35-53-114]OYZ62658.1 MAG: sodium-independent anion transporter [Gallionellales bacterium 24-53-125]OZB09733.1 MAG: sodium-independent anion transporter [Gallionellales bacterium 39-52-133]HQS57705.1 SulP family inorganic anion transporter [Gallionellaceae bacterium]HQS74159.1 SulP family inorganic anion transporter [Gallionellaceae bacterium]